MQFQQFQSKYILRLDPGEEIVNSLQSFCEEQKIFLGQIYGIGAVNKAEVGLFNPKTRKYHSKKFNRNFEIAPLFGNISIMQEKIYLHLHINLCDEDHLCFGGHLNSAVVSATFEGIIEKIEGWLEREFSQKIGLNILKF